MNVRYPKGEIVWVTYHYAGGDPAFFIASKPSRDYYYLYEVSKDGSTQKIGKAKNPGELEDKFQICKKCTLANGAHE